MSMSKTRKRLQDKLRRKFKWETRNNHGSGTYLIKPNAFHPLSRPGEELALDMAFYIDWTEIYHKTGNDISVYLTKLKKSENGNWDEMCTLVGCLSFEELEMIYNIAKNFREEVEEFRMKGENNG